MHVVARLLNLRGKWEIKKLSAALSRLGERFRKMTRKLKAVSPNDMLPEVLVKKFQDFDWTPRPAKVKPSATTANDMRAEPAKRLPIGKLVGPSGVGLRVMNPNNPRSRLNSARRLKMKRTRLPSLSSLPNQPLSLLKLRLPSLRLTRHLRL